MGVLVKLIGSGVGLAAEAIAHHKGKSRSSSPSAPPQIKASSSREAPDYPPPAYEEVVEVPDERAGKCNCARVFCPCPCFVDSIDDLLNYGLKEHFEFSNILKFISRFSMSASDSTEQY